MKKVRTSDHRSEGVKREVDDGPGLDEVVGGVHDLAVDLRRRGRGDGVRGCRTLGFPINEAGRLLVDAVGRDLGLDLVDGLERRVEAQPSSPDTE